MTKLIQRFALQTFQRMGFDLTRYRPEDSARARLDRTLAHFGIELLLDVGANTGQYAQSVRRSGYRGRIVSFEPLRSAHSQLAINAASDPLWQVHERCAVGNAPGEIDINVSGNSVSSSIRPMLSLHKDAAPDSTYVGTERVKMISLDSVFPACRTRNEVTFLKIDTQGYEREVIEGAAASLAAVKAIQLELSLVPLYEGQALWEFFFADLARRGFKVWAFMPGLADPRTGQSLQVEAIFYRAGA